MINRRSYYREALAPQAVSGSSVVTGPTIDREAANNVLAETLDVIVQSGAVGGAPSEVSIAIQVQHCDDDSTWVNVPQDFMYLDGNANSTGYGQNSAATLSGNATVAADQVQVIRIDARSLARYVQTIFTPTFTSGTSPSIQLSGTYHFTDPQTAPVS